MSSCIFQVVPYPVGDSHTKALEDFKRDHIALCASLQDACDGKLLEVYPPEIHNPYPIGVTLQSFTAMRDVSKVVHRGISALVNNYFNDTRLCDEILKLDHRAVEVLRSVQHLHYNIGAWRPDILFPSDDLTGFKICEINARFPFNAFFSSHEKNNILDGLEYLRDIPVMSVQELENIPKVFKDVFNTKKSVGILKEKDGGWDVNLFQVSYSESSATEAPALVRSVSAPLSPTNSPVLMRSVSFPHPPSALRQFSNTFQNVEARFVKPESLRLDEHNGVLKDEFGDLDQFALECDQSTLLSMDSKILSVIIEKSVYINDIRTILIAHDKRLLSALTDPIIMRAYLSEEDVQILQRYVIKTYVIGCCDSEILSTAKKSRFNWLVKPNGAGKGEGIVFGSDVDDAEWVALLDDPARQNFILQPKIPQRNFNILTAKGYQQMLVVGLLHNFNDNFLGPGIFRASSLSNPIVNVAGGNGIILSPCIVSSRFPLVRKALDTLESAEESEFFPVGQSKQSHGVDYKHLVASESTNLHFHFPEHCSFKLATASEGVSVVHSTSEVVHANNFDNVLAALMTEGIVKIETDWPTDNVNDKLIDVVSHLGILNSHSSSESDVWDVRPVIDISSVASSEPRPARSHTSEEFPMHTDCSFEEIPPRYMLLYVVEEDHHHGGLTTLIDSTVLIRYLSKKTLAALHKYEYEMKVPVEFFKGKKTIRGRILSAGKLWRYRSDVIVRESCNMEQIAALNELDNILQNPRIVLTTTLKKGTIFLLDNSRWFHGRTAIHDKDRWLKRIRFHPKCYDAVEKPFSVALTRSVTLGISNPESSGCTSFKRLSRKSITLSQTGVFRRLQMATELLLKIGEESLVINYEYYLREQLKHIESLQYYMIDFKSVPMSLFKFSATDKILVFSMSGAPLEWLILQTVSIIITGSRAEFLINTDGTNDESYGYFRDIVEPFYEVINIVENSSVDDNAYFYRGDLINDGSSIILASLNPSMKDLCVREVKGLDYLKTKYPTTEFTEIVDEFDIIDPTDIALFAKERSDYIASEAIRRSTFYKSETGYTLENLPVINGETLVHKIDDILTRKKYDISFVSGGTTGTTKFVFRTFWEDQENARYIAKGLLASGLTPGDVVCNSLSSGFWGGMHVFNLALQYLGCSLVPLGSSVPFDQTADFIRKLKPTALLAMPTWLLAFTENLRRQNITDIKIPKVITGGEMLFREAKDKVRLVLGVKENGFLSTGYTSNETGIIAFRCSVADEGYFHIHENMQHVSIEEPDDETETNKVEGADSQDSSGSILTSNLNRTLMPVLRYRIGDSGKIIPYHIRPCACGRKLAMLYLQGRCDNKIRLAARDLYVEEVAATIGMIPSLTLCFSVRIFKSSVTLLDALEIHVERQTSTDEARITSDEDIEQEFLRCLTICSPDFEPAVWEGLDPKMDRPKLVLHQPGTLPRNLRTGKITLVVDRRR